MSGKDTNHTLVTVHIYYQIKIHVLSILYDGHVRIISKTKRRCKAMFSLMNLNLHEFVCNTDQAVFIIDE